MNAWLAVQVVGLVTVAVAVALLAGWPWALLFAGVAAVLVGEVKS